MISVYPRFIKIVLRDNDHYDLYETNTYDHSDYSTPSKKYPSGVKISYPTPRILSDDLKKEISYKDGVFNLGNLSELYHESLRIRNIIFYQNNEDLAKTQAEQEARKQEVIEEENKKAEEYKAKMIVFLQEILSDTQTLKFLPDNDDDIIPDVKDSMTGEYHHGILESTLLQARKMGRDGEPYSEIRDFIVYRLNTVMWGPEFYHYYKLDNEKIEESYDPWYDEDDEHENRKKERLLKYYQHLDKWWSNLPESWKHLTYNYSLAKELVGYTNHFYQDFVQKDNKEREERQRIEQEEELIEFCEQLAQIKQRNNLFINSRDSLLYNLSTILSLLRLASKEEIKSEVVLFLKKIIGPEIVDIQNEEDNDVLSLIKEVLDSGSEENVDAYDALGSLKEEIFNDMYLINNHLYNNDNNDNEILLPEAVYAEILSEDFDLDAVYLTEYEGKAFVLKFNNFRILDIHSYYYPDQSVRENLTWLNGIEVALQMAGLKSKYVYSKSYNDLVRRFEKKKQKAMKELFFDDTVYFAQNQAMQLTGANIPFDVLKEWMLPDIDKYSEQIVKYQIKKLIHNKIFGENYTMPNEESDPITCLNYINRLKEYFNEKGWLDENKFNIIYSGDLILLEKEIKEINRIQEEKDKVSRKELFAMHFVPKKVHDTGNYVFKITEVDLGKLEAKGIMLETNTDHGFKPGDDLLFIASKDDSYYDEDDNYIEGHFYALNDDGSINEYALDYFIVEFDRIGAGS